MIRRGPTLIALEDDVDAHLQRIFLRYALAADLECLHLNDPESASRNSESPERNATGSTMPKTDLTASGTRRPALTISSRTDPPLKVTYASSQELELHSGRTVHSPEPTEARISNPSVF